MNDFTKEELQIMHLELDKYVKNTGVLKVPEHVINLRDKVESMIDNYCKHKEIVKGAYSKSNPPKKCDACGVLYR